MKRTLASSSADMSIIIRIYVIIKGRKQLIIDNFKRHGCQIEILGI